MTNFFVSKARRRAGRVVDLKVPNDSTSDGSDEVVMSVVMVVLWWCR